MPSGLSPFQSTLKSKAATRWQSVDRCWLHTSTLDFHQVVFATPLAALSIPQFQLPLLPSAFCLLPSAFCNTSISGNCPLIFGQSTRKYRFLRLLPVHQEGTNVREPGKLPIFMHWLLVYRCTNFSLCLYPLCSFLLLRSQQKL
jgi:hypothetical protein